MKPGRTVGLEAVHERIDARGRGDIRRQTDGEFRIADNHPGHHLRMKDDLLLVRDLVDDHAGAPDFRAGAGRGRHCDHGSNAAPVGTRPPVSDILEIPQRPRLARHEGDHFAGVQRRAAAEGDHAIVITAPVGGQAGIDVGRHRIAAHICEQSCSRHQRARLLHHRRRAQAFVGHQQRSPDAQQAAGRCKFGDAAGAGPDGGRIIPVRLEYDTHVVTRR
jgi:hypothetical protein